MCNLVNTYKTCALFGHSIPEAANANGFETVLCEEARANNNTLGECSSVEACNVADFSCPLCTECDELDHEARKKVEAILELNEEASAVKTPVITEDFIEHLCGLPIDRSKAPDVPATEMHEFLRQGAKRDVPEIDQRRAEAWTRCKRRNSGSEVDLPVATRQIFAHWLVMACKARHIMDARRIAYECDDRNRNVLLESLTTQTSLAPVYRARLVNLGVFDNYLYLAGIGEFAAPVVWLPTDLDSVSEDIVTDASHTDQQSDIRDPITNERLKL
ncbi:hypothetical protein E8E14_009757 [Neopestalotiopsis sp. 37M]|nr:hypothetical protein E8E14_009757 [Neopestalotiopsis sp. 37M]